jgi:uncharacterized protein YjbI with pentapeptide repeats
LCAIDHKDAKLVDASLRGAYLRDANLSGVNLNHADLRGVDPEQQRQPD